jgi:serine/threonine protein phosphatase PrpC
VFTSSISSKKLPFRVYPGNLSVTRTIGDIHLKKENEGIIIPEPDLYHLSTKGLSYLVLFSDGVY